MIYPRITVTLVLVALVAPLSVCEGQIIRLRWEESGHFEPDYVKPPFSWSDDPIAVDIYCDFTLLRGSPGADPALLAVLLDTRPAHSLFRPPAVGVGASSPLGPLNAKPAVLPFDSHTFDSSPFVADIAFAGTLGAAYALPALPARLPFDAADFETNRLLFGGARVYGRPGIEGPGGIYLLGRDLDPVYQSSGEGLANAYSDPGNDWLRRVAEVARLSPWAAMALVGVVFWRRWWTRVVRRRFRKRRFPAA